jgi:hypothetical protein
MKEYEFWYDDIATYKVRFQANSLEEAQKLVDKVFSTGEIEVEHLPYVSSKHKGNELFPTDLEEISE